MRGWSARVRLAIGVLAASVMVLGVLAAGGLGTAGGKAKGKKAARAALVDADGDRIGNVRLEQRAGRGPVRVSVNARELSPGFHGFHVHATGKCEGPDFVSAGSHLNPAGATHPAHAGDMPVLLVAENGRAAARFATDRFSIRDLRDDDGSAIIVHALPDNYANIPTDRYDPDPDATTLGTGDAGGRVACGVVK
jgi:superoxide dismutase, Cu-Zn family